ncbi:hypothetical protein XHC_0012 [Xanthomonas hortorum pv. carotae str. M081]|nr:hypothetical protein XHC_0012 [Xanthomonas hortorum pv. carotae str. M081]
MRDRFAARRFGSVFEHCFCAAASANAEYAVMAKVLVAAKNAQAARISFVQ